MNDRRATETGKKNRKREHCEASGKLKFRTRRKALRENGKMSLLGGPRASEAYVCRHCGFWHITRIGT